MSEYDFFIAGRWRNCDSIRRILNMVRENGFTAYCFIENEYKGDGLEIGGDGDPNVFMDHFDAAPQNGAIIRNIFDIDMKGERKSAAFLLVLPAGNAAHIEAGIAYGLGKKCYAVGSVEKTESLYCIFEQIFADVATLQEWLRSNRKIAQ